MSWVHIIFLKHSPSGRAAPLEVSMGDVLSVHPKPFRVSTSFRTGCPAPTEIRTKEIASIERACKAGKDPESRKWIKGDTAAQTDQITGVLTVSVKEAKCLMDRLGDQLLVIHTGKDTSWQVPNTKYFSPYKGRSDVDKMREAELLQFADGDRSRPVMFYGENFDSLDTVFAAGAAGQGYKWPKVYWMRFGVQGWREAGFEAEPGKPGGQPSHADALTKQFEAAAVAALRQNAAPSSKATAPTAESNHQATATPPTSAFAPSRSRTAPEPETGPYITYKSSIDAIDATKLVDILANARSVRTLREVCGEVGSSLPNSNAEIEAAKQRFKAYSSCGNRFAQNVPASIDVSYFESATSLMAKTTGYTCSRSSEKNCIPDAVWRRAGDVATMDNLKMVQAAAERRRNRNQEIQDAMARQEAYHDEVKYHLERLNEERRAGSYAPSYTPSYQAPPAYQPPVFTPPSNSVLYPYRK